MKAILVAAVMAVASAGLAPIDVEAKRLGGGGSSGMKRDIPARSAPDSAPAKPAAPAAAPNTAGAAPAAAAPKRSWMGPLAGIAAGLGLAALMSHLGLGEEFANIIMLALLAFAAIFVIRWLMRRFSPAAQGVAVPSRGMQFAGVPGGADSLALPRGGSGPSALTPAVEQAAGALRNLPEDFDAAAFERLAKLIFIRLQAAHDAGDLNDLRAFTTPELFASIRLDLQERAAAPQQTDVVKIDASIIDYAQEPERLVVSVRFHGLIREEKDSAAQPFDEIWHLVKPVDGSQEWAIAGIQQTG